MGEELNRGREEAHERAAELCWDWFACSFSKRQQLGVHLVGVSCWTKLWQTHADAPFQMSAPCHCRMPNQHCVYLMNVCTPSPQHYDRWGAPLLEANPAGAVSTC